MELRGFDPLTQRILDWVHVPNLRRLSVSAGFLLNTPHTSTLQKSTAGRGGFANNTRTHTSGRQKSDTYTTTHITTTTTTTQSVSLQADRLCVLLTHVWKCQKLSDFRLTLMESNDRMQLIAHCQRKGTAALASDIIHILKCVHKLTHGSVCGVCVPLLTNNMMASLSRVLPGNQIVRLSTLCHEDPVRPPSLSSLLSGLPLLSCFDFGNPMCVQPPHSVQQDTAVQSTRRHARTLMEKSGFTNGDSPEYYDHPSVWLRCVEKKETARAQVHARARTAVGGGVSVRGGGERRVGGVGFERESVLYVGGVARSVRTNPDDGPFSNRHEDNTHTHTPPVQETVGV
eukprot:GDKI01030557.1.p1 GENE.GDKI01030557.1~~GDKI01030557.1.p1  ORF type:complete len:343 (-),score=135.26 GDKI01030557.1:384-1412(-)